MKKRLRKKLHKGEFAEFACTVRIVPSGFTDEAEMDQWIDEMIDLGTEQGVTVGSLWCGPNEATLTFDAPRREKTQAARDAFLERLRTRFPEGTVDASPIFDAWNEYYNFRSGRIVR